MVCAGDIYYHIYTRTVPDNVTARLNFGIHLGPEFMVYYGNLGARGLGNITPESQ